MKRHPLELLAIFPALILGWLVWRYGVNLPVWDEWNVPGVAIVQSVTEQITWEDWIYQHNESRKLFPRLLFVPLARLTNWNIKYEMLVSFLLACSISFNVYHLSKITLNCSPRKRSVYLLLANLLIFSPMQWDNWLWGLQAITFVPIASITTSLAIIFSRNSLFIKFVSSGILATVATFSFANGLLSWIVILPALIWSCQHKKRIPLIVAGWLLLFALNLTIYFHDFVKSESSPSPLEAFVNPFKTIAYFVSFVGSPLGLQALQINIFFGLIVIILFCLSCYYLWRNKQNNGLLNRAFPWFLTGSYTIGSGILTTIGRVGFGVGQSLESRYITFSTYGMLSLIYLIGIILSDLNNKGSKLSFWEKLVKQKAYILSIVFVLVYFANFGVGTNKIIAINKERLYAKACLTFVYQIDNSDCIKKQIYPQLDELYPIAEQIDNIGYLQPPLLISDRLDRISKENSLGLVYGMFDSLERDENGNYLASGWSVLPKDNRPAHAVILAYQAIDNVPKAFALVQPNQKRQDVAQNSRKPGYLQSGWSKSFSSDLIPQDAVSLSAWSYDSNIGRAYKLTVEHQIER